MSLIGVGTVVTSRSSTLWKCRPLFGLTPWSVIQREPALATLRQLLFDRQWKHTGHYIYHIYPIMTHSPSGVLNSSFQVLDDNSQWRLQPPQRVQVPKQDVTYQEQFQGGHPHHHN